MNRFFVFITIILVVYFGMNLAGFYWLRFMFRPLGTIKIWFNIGFWLLAISLVLGRFLESIKGGWVSAVILNIGYIWLGFLFYFVLLAALTGLLVQGIRILEKTGWIRIPLDAMDSGFPVTGILIVGGLVVLAIAGMCSIRTPVVRNFEICVPSKPSFQSTLTIVQLSDLHLDRLKSVACWEKIVERTNNLHPDIIVLTGDIIDENPNDLTEFEPGLKKLRARYNVVGITGNHEFYINTTGAMKLMRECGITMLRNEGFLIPETAYLIGIDDPTGIGTSDLQPPDFEQIKNNIPTGLPVIVLNHQPVYIDEICHLGADLQLSGHTHDGQIWPFKWINRMVFRYQNGLHRIGNLHLYVSSGTGTWGPPFRIGTRSEIAVFTIRPL
ncbi:metallophosphoesterase [bacterium]|nr:metallophosphoesterase [candidate division CSSED10-310 bacterium]